MSGLARCLLAGVVSLALAGCADDDPPPDASPMPPLTYDYLTPIRLNVASVDVVDQSAPSPGAADDPSPPADALRRMAADRLQALGVAGRAVFTIQQASINQRGPGAYDGALMVRVDINAPDRPEPAAFATASVSRSVAVERGGRRRTLYELTKQMMDAMNVELEYQVRRGLKEWLVTAPPAPAVEQSPLPPPAS